MNRTAFVTISHCQVVFPLCTRAKIETISPILYFLCGAHDFLFELILFHADAQIRIHAHMTAFALLGTDAPPSPFGLIGQSAHEDVQFTGD